MKKVELIIIICMMLILMFLPISSAINIKKTDTQIYEQINENEYNYFFCYVNSSGIKTSYIRSFVIRHGYTGLTFALGLFTVYSEDAQTTIYKNKNGEVLMHYEGVHELNLIGFIGYSSAKQNEDIWIEGNVIFVSMKW
jgi:hypothetical protein